MGIPKFFKWLSNKVPSMIYNVDDKLNQCVDHFYIDFNGILYMCKEQFDNNGEEGEQFMINVFLYIEELVYRVSPKKTLMISMDGVPPNAKIQQQRQRRWRSYAKKQQTQNKEKEGDDKNITSFKKQTSFSPGTEFMSYIGSYMHYFVRRKIQDDHRWQNIRVYLSDTSIPGEGEHKIMDFIRSYRKQYPDQCMQETHCMYGMDADLIMLALSTHIPNFILLREHVLVDIPLSKYSKVKRKESNQFKQNQRILEKRRFQILDVNILRRYIDHEFQDILEGHKVNFDYNINHLIDDFILMLFLCGNDFLPNIPTLDIGEEALDYFFGIYKVALPDFGGYITDTLDKNVPIIHFDRLEKYLHILSQYEQPVLDKRFKKDISFKQRFKQLKAIQERKQQQQQTSPSTSQTTISNQSSTSTKSEFKLLFSSINESYKNLLTVIDTANLTAINCKGDVKRLIMVGSLVSSAQTSDSQLKDSNTSLQSDVDEQMLIKILFKRPVTLNSMLLFSENSAPKTIKLYINQPDIDFSSVDTTKSAQEFILPDNIATLSLQNLELKLNPLKFVTVEQITIFIPNNASGSKTTRITRLSFFGNVIDLSKKNSKPKKDLTTILSDYRKAHDHAHGHEHHKHGHKHGCGVECENSEHEHNHDQTSNEPKRQKVGKYVLLPPPKDVSQFSEFNIFPYCMSFNSNNQDLTVDLNEYKKQYYLRKMNVSTEEEILRLIKRYCEGLCFVFIYYYYGLCSWNWNYPYYYAPFASDLATLYKRAIGSKISFSMDFPLSPMQHLLSIIPPNAFSLLPHSYEQLVLDKNSPIADLFPSTVKIDTTEQRSKFESVVHVPFIDPDRIRKATESLEMDANEERRNNVGNVYMFWYDPNFCLDIFKSPFPDKLESIHDCHVNSMVVPPSELPQHLQPSSHNFSTNLELE